MEEQVVKFLSTVEKLKTTLRHNWTTTGRQESVAEHTWRVALFFIIVQDLYKYDVDVVKVLKMIIVHDIPELVAGDIPAFESKRKKKKMNEILSAKKVFRQLPSPLNKEYFDLFKEFEEGVSPEAKLAEALEKIESQLQHLDSGPTYWSDKEKGAHMLNYPNKALKRLDDKRIQKIWDIVKEKIDKLT